jgi:transcriptional regulator with XRE-family HTH domain
MLFYKMKKKNEDLGLILEVEQKKIGLRFKHLRKQKGYSSHETFAYGKIEAGASNMTLKVFIKHLNAIGISFREFFNEEYENTESGELKSN